MSAPDPAPVLDLIGGFRRSKTMFTAVTLGLFDRLPATAAELAAAIGARAEALERGAASLREGIARGIETVGMAGA